MVMKVLVLVAATRRYSELLNILAHHLAFIINKYITILLYYHIATFPLYVNANSILRKRAPLRSKTLDPQTWSPQH